MFSRMDPSSGFRREETSERDAPAMWTLEPKLPPSTEPRVELISEGSSSARICSAPSTAAAAPRMLCPRLSPRWCCPSGTADISTSPSFSPAILSPRASPVPALPTNDTR